MPCLTLVEDSDKMTGDSVVEDVQFEVGLPVLGVELDDLRSKILLVRPPTSVPDTPPETTLLLRLRKHAKKVDDGEGRPMIPAKHGNQ